MCMESSLGRPAKLRGKRILVVEDEPLVSMLVEDELRDAGAEVVGPVPSVERGAAADRGGGGRWRDQRRGARHQPAGASSVRRWPTGWPRSACRSCSPRATARAATRAGTGPRRSCTSRSRRKGWSLPSRPLHPPGCDAAGDGEWHAAQARRARYHRPPDRQAHAAPAQFRREVLLERNSVCCATDDATPVAPRSALKAPCRANKAGHGGGAARPRDLRPLLRRQRAGPRSCRRSASATCPTAHASSADR